MWKQYRQARLKIPRLECQLCEFYCYKNEHLARASHARKHVRRGEATEHIMGDGRYGWFVAEKKSTAAWMSRGR